MAISYVGGATSTSAGNTDVSVSLAALTGGSDSAPSTDDLIIFAYNIADADNADLNLACNTAGFAEIADLFGDGTNDANLGVFWKLFVAETAVVGEGSLGGTDTAIQGVAMVFRGVDTGAPFDVASTTNQGTTGGNPDPPSINHNNPTGLWTVIVGANAHTANADGTFTAPTGYTTDFLTVGNQDTADGIIGMGYNTAPSDPEDPGAMTSSHTATGWCAVTMALRPAEETIDSTDGAIAAQASALDGTGLSASSSTDGAISAQAAVVTGSGLSTSTGTGTLAASIATLDGTGTVENPAISGTGALVIQAATLAGAGLTASSGTGALLAPSATLAGTGLSLSAGTGALIMQAATLAGAGLTLSTGTGVLVAPSSTVTGTGVAGVSSITGTGSLLVSAASLSGTGLTVSSGTGTLSAQPSTLVGMGLTSTSGTGVLAASSSSLLGAGLSYSSGTGLLPTQVVTLAGVGTVGDAAISGTGALASVVAHVSGTGLVSTVEPARARIPARLQKAAGLRMVGRMRVTEW
jgi:hypothetical protein